MRNNLMNALDTIVIPTARWLECSNRMKTPEFDYLQMFGETDSDHDFEYGIPGIRQVIFNNPATIILWSDGTKTVVKCMDEDTFDEYNGFMAAVCKKMFGSNTAVKKIVEKYIAQEPVPHADI